MYAIRYNQQAATEQSDAIHLEQCVATKTWKQ